MSIFISQYKDLFNVTLSLTEISLFLFAIRFAISVIKGRLKSRLYAKLKLFYFKDSLCILNDSFPSFKSKV